MCRPRSDLQGHEVAARTGHDGLGGDDLGHETLSSGSNGKTTGRDAAHRRVVVIGFLPIIGLAVGSGLSTRRSDHYVFGVPTFVKAIDKDRRDAGEHGDLGENDASADRHLPGGRPDRDAHFCVAPVAHAEDGHDLWLRYRPVEAGAGYAAAAIAPVADTPTLNVARAELERGLTGLVGAPSATADRVILIGTPESSSAIAKLALPLKAAGDEGYLIRTLTVDGKATTVIAANRDVGVLYGVFAICADPDPAAGRQARHRLGPEGQAADAEPLGQPGSHRRARLCGPVDLGLVEAARLQRRSTLCRLRPRQRLDRHQRHGAEQRQRQGRQPDRALYRQGRAPWPTCSGPTASRSICRPASRPRSRSGG
jgi:hypothetical protein